MRENLFWGCWNDIDEQLEMYNKIPPSISSSAVRSLVMCPKLRERKPFAREKKRRNIVQLNVFTTEPITKTHTAGAIGY